MMSEGICQTTTQLEQQTNESIDILFSSFALPWMDGLMKHFKSKNKDQCLQQSNIHFPKWTATNIIKIGVSIISTFTATKPIFNGIKWGSKGKFIDPLNHELELYPNNHGFQAIQQ